MIARLCVFALLALPAAASAQQKPNPARPCYDALADDARFAPIRDKVALSGFAAEGLRAFTKSSDRASAQEAPALGAWKAAREACHQQELPYFATRDVEIQAAAREHFASLQALIDRLQAGAMTYGEFGRRRIELYENLSARVEKVRKEIIPPKPKPQPPG